uniref:Uncharacterized protein n=1 Tax=Anguilla anguilla TaxID=7936 RepID=A0A0E9VUP7_ANGAN
MGVLSWGVWLENKKIGKKMA